MFGIFSIFLILTYHSSVATSWATVAAVVEFCPSGHCRRGPGYQNDFSRISDGLWKENNVVPFQRFVWGQSQLVRCKKCTSCRVTVLHFSSSPTHHPPTHCLKGKMTRTISSLIRSLGLLITLTPDWLSTRLLHCYLIKLGNSALKPICCYVVWQPLFLLFKSCLQI